MRKLKKIRHTIAMWFFYKHHYISLYVHNNITRVNQRFSRWVFWKRARLREYCDRLKRSFFRWYVRVFFKEYYGRLFGLHSVLGVESPAVTITYIRSQYATSNMDYPKFIQNSEDFNRFVKRRLVDDVVSKIIDDSAIKVHTEDGDVEGETTVYSISVGFVEPGH